MYDQVHDKLHDEVKMFTNIWRIRQSGITQVHYVAPCRVDIDIDHQHQLCGMVCGMVRDAYTTHGACHDMMNIKECIMVITCHNMGLGGPIVSHLCRVSRHLVSSS